ncbi:MAG: tRNA (guanosine(37)-N1)-methyltransferase TrmD [Eubacterium sp.]|nr:tRNA (guanosine(37)-N1)-methyltransferase TrmD [Eubacterium sp.]
MRFQVLTLFPEMMQMIFSSSVTGKAMEKGIVSLYTINIRDFADNRYKHIDDYIYGGAGMLMQARPVFESFCCALEKCGITYDEYIAGAEITVAKTAETKKRPCVLYTTPQGRTFDQKMAEELKDEEDIIILCGHYEGIDERAIELIKPTEVSIGDFVLTGGELPAAVIMDSVTRLLPGALGKDDSALYESFYDNLLEYPQYTRPEEYMGLKVPPVLLSGHHKNIEKWRLEEAEKRTRDKRPDLYEKYLESRKNTKKNEKK